MNSTLSRPSKAYKSSPTRIRLGPILILLAFLALSVAAANWTYHWQRDRNTIRLLARAQSEAQAGRLDEAIEAYGLYIQRAEQDVDALRIYANLLHDRLAVSKSWIGPTVRALRQLNRMDPTDMEVVGKLVRLYIDLREFGLAVELGRTWYAATPQDPEAILMLARAFHGNNQNNEALQILSEAAMRDPAESRFYPPLIDLLSNVLQQQGQAAQWVLRGITYAPDAFEVQMSAHLYYQKTGEPEKARAHLERSIALAPDNLAVLVPAARYFLHVNDLARVEDLITHAKGLEPDSLELLSLRRAHAVAIADSNLLVEVAGDLQRAAGDDGAFLAQAAELYLRAGAVSQADKCIERIEQSSKSQTPKGALDTLRGARELLANQPHRAIVLLGSAVRQQPSDPWTLELLARAFVQTAAWPEAADLYRRLALISQSSTGPRLALARVEIQNQGFDRAREALAMLKPKSSAEEQQVRLLNVTIALRQESVEVREQAIVQLKELASEEMLGLANLEILLNALHVGDMHARAIEIWSAWSPTSTTVLRIALDLARRHLDAGEFERARAWSNALRQRSPDSQELALLELEERLAEGDNAGAIQFVEKVEEVQLKGMLWERIGDKAREADLQRTALVQAAGLRPLDIPVRQKLLRLTGDLSMATALVHEIRRIEGDQGLLWKFELASVRLQLDPSPPAASEARELLKSCLEARSGWTAARSLFGFANERLGNLSDAVEAYRAAIAAAPELSTSSIAFRLIDVLKRMGRFEEADAVLNAVARAMPESIDVQRLLTEQHIRRHDMHSAATIAEHLLRMKPEDENWASTTIDLLVLSDQADRAEQTARAAFANHPDSIAIASSFARSLLVQGRREEAVEFAESFAAKRPVAPAQILQARILVETGNPRKAENVLLQAMNRDPQNPVLHIAMAEFWAGEGDRARQLESARQAIKLQGEDPAQSLWLAGLLATGNSAERAEAKSILQTRLARDSNDLEALMLDAQLLLTEPQPDLDRADTRLTAALRINPRRMEAYKLLTAIHLRRGDLVRARDAAASGLMAASDDADMLILSAEVAQIRGDWDASMIPLRRLFTSAQPPIRAYELAATGAIRSHQIDSAIAMIEKGGYRPPEADIQLARLYETKGNLTRAGELFQSSAQKAPAAGTPALMLFLGRTNQWEQLEAAAGDDELELAHRLIAAEVLASMGSLPQDRWRGFEWLDRLATQHSNVMADARFRAGMAHLKHRDLVNSETMLLSAATLAPGNPKAANALAWLYGEELSNPQRGLDVLTAFERDGGVPTPELLDTYGMLLLRTGKWDQAEQKLRECLRVGGLSPVAASANFHLALIHIERGRADDARHCLNRALQLHESMGGLTPRQLDECRRMLAETVTSG